ncbi:MAG: hypothetical protein HFH25_11650 [Lachnospiraceae bacterium]|nr:hypothetical protein [Lachnospiraceae bacterium]
MKITAKHPIKYRRVRFALSVIVLLLAILAAGIPGALTLMRRADAQVALGNAKSLRIALQAASTRCYAADIPFHDASEKGGVTEEVWNQVITDSRVPGDFWVLQTAEDGYQVYRFLYQEGDFWVLYCQDPLTYQVSYQQPLIETLRQEGRNQP